MLFTLRVIDHILKDDRKDKKHPSPRERFLLSGGGRKGYSRASEEDLEDY